MHSAQMQPPGGGRLPIEVGHVSLTLHFSEVEMEHKAGRRYAAFHTSHTDGLPIFLEARTALGSTPVHFSYRLPDSSLLCLGADAAHFLGVRHEFGLDSLLRVLLSVLLLPRQGFLLHAATVVRDGRAYVFTGRSGAGKSTAAALSHPRSVLTDEISLVRAHRGAWHAYGTPFWGEFRAEGSNACFPLAGIYTLVQSTRNRIERLSAREGLRAMLSNVLFFSASKRETDQLLHLLAGIASQVPLYRLDFVQHPSFWEAIVP